MYTAERASAVAGVPRRALYRWAQSGLLVPAVSAPPLKLWSWADLIAARAVEWLRRPAGTEERPRATLEQVRRLVEDVQQTMARLGKAAASSAILLSADGAGVPAIEVADRIGAARHDGSEQGTHWFVVDLISAFPTARGLQGPDLVQPREGLRIIPGKLCGEPHVQDTRIETRVLRALHQRGYTCERILELYSDLWPEAVAGALDLEQQLQHNLSAA